MKLRHIAILILATALLMLGAGLALAADGNKTVGVVIAFPDGTSRAEMVTAPITATTYDVLQRAKIELVGTNGSFGPAVCSINKVGCPASNCFCDAKHFWAFYHLDQGTNQWVVAQEGVGAAVPADGAVEGFAWSEMDAKYNPVTKPPVVTLQQISAQGGGPAPAPAAAAPATPASAPSVMPSTGGGPGLVWIGAAGLALVLLGLAVVGRQAFWTGTRRAGKPRWP